MVLLKGRRSVRKYLPEKVDRKKINLCLEAARLAPSACNSQPYKFIVIDDRQTKENLRTAFNGIYSPCSFALSAPAIIAIVTQKQKLTARIGNLMQNIDFRYVDIGIAGEHFVLQAQELGLGTCWIGWFDKKKVNAVLGIPGGLAVEVMITLGYPAEKTKERSKKSFAELVSYNEY